MRLLILSTIVFLFCGCNDGRLTTFPVSGKVVFEDGGYPMFGDIEFYEPTKQINARGKIARDGTFSLGTYEKDDGAVEGNHKVVIIQRTRNHYAAQVESAIEHDHGDLIDDLYFDYRTSGLTAEIKSVENNQLELTVKRMPEREAKDSD